MSDYIKRVILAPHCDDETLGCGGLLAKYPEECGVVVFSKPDPVREKEFTRAREILGYDKFRFLNLRDGSLANNMRQMVGMLDEVLTEWAPDELYIPHPGSHQDHIAVYESGVRAARLSMTDHHHFTPTVLIYNIPVYDIELYPSGITWNLFESLTEDQIDRKIAALEAYDSQSVVGPHPANSVKQQAHLMGASHQLAYAEEFALVRGVRL